MIYINRLRTDEHGRPIKPSDTWFKAAEEATQKALEEAGAHTVDRGVYAHAEVSMALEKLFFDKCAYCESPITAASDWDVEHFRPKGRVAERQDHPGYYWLAYTWENLYPSCQHCNQSRKDKPRWDDPSAGPAMGKAYQFPIVDEDRRAFAPGDEHREAPLLLDPCGDDPTRYLMYDPTGQIFAHDENANGATTIRVCHLDRGRLQDARKHYIHMAIAALEGIKRGKERGDDVAAAEFEQFLNERIIGDHCPYAGAARCVRDHPDCFGL